MLMICSLWCRLVQLLPWRSWRALGLRHRKTSDIRKRGALVEGTARPRGHKHRDHACRQ